MGLKGITTRVSGTQKVTLVKGGGGGGGGSDPPPPNGPLPRTFPRGTLHSGSVLSVFYSRLKGILLP